ncbi:hypothetical protein [Celeribacter litoreus]|uniref:hypothetical protein n=1 Tax=Celeribacter litoreus TaxID=2876714 RepID=UPI001CCE9C1F|nr:hypothetical protein [Celeribacter litoreus]MCA0044665.1 hypothetical protein [Celeribacter litoreus]
MTNDISNYLLKNGPKLTSDILRYLEETGLSPDTARQRLKRRPTSIKALSGLSFPKNARFYFHEAHFGTHWYWDGLYDALTGGSPTYGPAIAGMIAKGGIIPKDFFPIISGAPLKQKKKTGSDAVLARLKGIGFLTEFNVGETPVVAFHHHSGFPVDLDSYAAQLTVQRVLLDTVADWARKLGMVSYNKVAIRERSQALPQFGTHAFDLVAPSYLTPMVRYADGKPKPGFLVADVYLGELNKATAQAFLRKCESSRAMRRLPPFLPVLIADGFHPDAFHELRSNGIIATKPSALFGRDVARGLAGLLETLRNASAIAAKNPEVIETLFSQLGHIEGAAGNLRGALFELIVGHIATLQGGGSIDIGKKVVIDTTERYEVDVFCVSAETVRLIECKGYAPTHRVDAEELEAWIRTKARRLNKHFRAQETLQNRVFSFEFWTSGGFTKEALQLAETVSNETKRYSVKLVAGPDVRSLITKVNAKGLGKVFDEHYAKHPITKAERKFEAIEDFGSVLEEL